MLKEFPNDNLTCTFTNHNENTHKGISQKEMSLKDDLVHFVSARRFHKLFPDKEILITADMLRTKKEEMLPSLIKQERIYADGKQIAGPPSPDRRSGVNGRAPGNSENGQGTNPGVIGREGSGSSSVSASASASGPGRYGDATAEIAALVASAQEAENGAENVGTENAAGSADARGSADPPADPATEKT